MAQPTTQQRKLDALTPRPPEQYLNNAPRVRVMRTIRDWISDGRLPRGERLPSEQSLADQMSVSRLTVRAALRELEGEGLLECFPRRGRFVANHVTPTRSAMADVVAILGQKLASGALRRSGWHDSVQAGAMEAIEAAGLHVLTLNRDLLSGNDLRHLITAKPRGVLIVQRPKASAPTQEIDALEAFRGASIPLVSFGSAPTAGNLDTVESDHEAGAYELTRWLLAQGKRRILRFWSYDPEPDASRPAWLQQRDAGYERACREAGVEILPAVELPAVAVLNPRVDLYQVFQRDVRTAAGYLLPYLTPQPGIDAVMATSDGQTFSVAAAMKMLKIQPNRDVLIVGYDNYWMDLPHLQWESDVPLAATVDKQNFEIGQEMLRLLEQRIEGDIPAGQPQHRLLQPKLVVVDARQPSASS